MTKKCPDCKKFMKETLHGWVCNCGYEEIVHIEDLHTTNPKRGWY